MKTFSSVGLVACCTLVLAFSVESDALVHESTYGTPFYYCSWVKPL